MRFIRNPSSGKMHEIAVEAQKSPVEIAGEPHDGSSRRSLRARPRRREGRAASRHPAPLPDGLARLGAVGRPHADDVPAGSGAALRLLWPPAVAMGGEARMTA